MYDKLGARMGVLHIFEVTRLYPSVNVALAGPDVDFSARDSRGVSTEEHIREK